MDNKFIRTQKELEILREGAASDWRKDIQGDHPFVDVMPHTNQAAIDAEKKVKEKKKVEKEVKEDYEGYEYVGKEGKQHKVSDGISTKHLTNKEFGEFSRQKLGRSKKKEVKEANSPPKMPPRSTHPDDTKAHAKDDKFNKSLSMRDPKKEINSLESKQKAGEDLGAMGRARLNLYKHKFGKKK